MVNSAVYSSGIAVTGVASGLNGAAGTADSTQPAKPGNAQEAIIQSNAFGTLNDGATFTANASQFGSATLKATLEQRVTGTTYRSIAPTVAVSIESIDPTKVPLNYSLENIASLYAAVDSGLLTAAQKLLLLVLLQKLCL